MPKTKKLYHPFALMAQSKDWVQLLNVEMLMLPEQSLQQKLHSYIHELGYRKVIFYQDLAEPKNNYIFAEGTEPWLLVAHTDTVKPTPTELMYTYSSKDAHLQFPRFISGVGGLGADDRSGVAMAVRLLHDGHRPHLFFPSGEESGLLGTRQFIKAFDPKSIKVNFMFQFDRQGNNDIVNYDDASKELMNHFTKEYFVESIGSFTDIKDLMPFFNVSGLNFSVGYTNQHTASEVLDLNGFYNVYLSFTKLFSTLPKDKPFEFLTKKYTYEQVSLFPDYRYDTTYVSTASLTDVNNKRQDTTWSEAVSEHLECSICNHSSSVETNFILDGEVVCDLCFNGLSNLHLFLCNDCGAFTSLNFLSDFEFDFSKQTLKPSCSECMGNTLVPFGTTKEKKETVDKLMNAVLKGIANEK